MTPGHSEWRSLLQCNMHRLLVSKISPMNHCTQLSKYYHCLTITVRNNKCPCAIFTFFHLVFPAKSIISVGLGFISFFFILSLFENSKTRLVTFSQMLHRCAVVDDFLSTNHARVSALLGDADFFICIFFFRKQESAINPNCFESAEGSWQGFLDSECFWVARRVDNSTSSITMRQKQLIIS